MKKLSKVENMSEENKINKYYVIIGGAIMLLVVALLIFSVSENTKQYLVDQGTLEHTEITTSYIIKKEKTVDKDQTKVLVPVVAEGSKTSKGDILATYKGDEYANYEETLRDMDKEILERMQDLPTVYSSEVDAIEDTIYLLVKESIGEASYNKMQEYKQKINTNISKRANIIGELSPSGAEIRKLITERNKYEKSAKKSNDNILSPMTGIVSYNTDGLEDDLVYSNINKLDYNTIKEIVNTKKEADNTKIKVVNNYEAYVVARASLDNLEYIEAGYNYRLKLIEQDNYELLGTLEKVNKTEDGIEVYFKITNGIEHIIDLREAEIEIVWGYADGLIVPVEAINKYTEKDTYYISVIDYNGHENIPIKLKLKNDNYAVVSNYTDDELAELGLTSAYDLQLYDRIIIESKK